MLLACVLRNAVTVRPLKSMRLIYRRKLHRCDRTHKRLSQRTQAETRARERARDANSLVERNRSHTSVLIHTRPFQARNYRQINHDHAHAINRALQFDYHLSLSLSSSSVTHRPSDTSEYRSAADRPETLKHESPLLCARKRDV